MVLAHVFSAIDLCRHFSKKTTLLLSDRLDVSSSADYVILTHHGCCAGDEMLH